MSLDCHTALKSLHFSDEQLNLASGQPIPRHVAIIMDGNRRWARRGQDECKNISVLNGHWVGANVLTQVVEAAADIGIKILTVYGFSTENWGRSSEEVDSLLQILCCYLENNRQKMVTQGVRFHPIGDLTPFSESLKQTIESTVKATARGKKVDLVIALNYGGRDELCRAFLKMVEDLSQGKLRKDQITEDRVSYYLDTAPFGDPDLLIRTSGEKRLSNFLLWQLAYTEVYMTEVLWPDFTPRDLLNAVIDFQKRQRRIGK
jgi:undecaprenyl diphosphate synthase